MAAPAVAQDLAARPVAPPATSGDTETPTDDQQITFSATDLSYDDDNDIATATGDVRMLRAGSRLRADKVVWNRKTGRIVASGNVATVSPGGDTTYADQIDLTDDMKNGVADNLLLVLADGGRLAARHSTKDGDRTTLDRAAYTPCRVVDASDCPKTPSWQITAVRVVLDQGKHRIYYRDARFRLFGLTVMALPGFSHPDGSGNGGGGTGLLLPNMQVSKATGVELDLPYYLQLAPNRDLTVTPHVYSAVPPALELLYRNLDQIGAYQIRGMVTAGSRLPASINPLPGDKNHGLRGFIDANGTWQLGPDWTIHAAIRAETDRTFMKRFDISNDDRLRSTIRAERIDDDSYLSIAGWFVQEIRAGYSQGQQPIAMPEIDYRRRVKDPWLGGTFQAELNTLALTRTEGQDTQRAFAGLRWDLTKLTPLGQLVTFTAYGRGDVYHTAGAGETDIVAYRGQNGWQTRGIGLVAVDMRWPFVGELFGGTQQIVPRVQFVGQPHTKNVTIPDEDSRAVDLEDSNLFALNRFSGYDRWDDSSRVTYGAEWNYTRPAFEVHGVIGQSYRLSTEPTILPSGTGLSGQFSDYVGRVTVKYGNFVEFTERFRLDKSTLAVRRSEFDATVGTRNTYFLVGYLRLNRDIDPTIADLRDDSEVRFAGRIQIARYWSIFGSTVIDLTKRSDDPTSLSDGFSPVRDRVGLVYENECISLGLTWRRDYDPTGDARRGSTFSLRLALKNVGR
nr:LPS assembly protein LptD [Sphingomonas nostoxanthinifaciens]